MNITIVFSVEPMNEMGQISGPAPVFELKAGDYSGCCENTYSVSTNETNKKISASLDSDMPPYTSLQIKLAPPSGAKSTGWQTLSATPVDLVIEISEVSGEDLSMTYLFSAEPKAGVIKNTTRIVYYTMTDG
ncbi:MAG: hypothetical protein FJZ58_01210 [Chlamydiae bacterium]|nr:hypothetical protein [Chlamydiota bacterium]